MKYQFHLGNFILRSFWRKTLLLTFFQFNLGALNLRRFVFRNGKVYDQNVGWNLGLFKLVPWPEMCGEQISILQRFWEIECFTNANEILLSTLRLSIFSRLVSGNSKNENINTCEFWSEICCPWLITFYYFKKCWRLIRT